MINNEGIKANLVFQFVRMKIVLRLLNLSSMENYRARFLWLCMVIFLLRPAKAEYNLQPLKNVNLSPFWQWRSAYECMQNVSATCQAKDQVTLAGVVDVNQSEVAEYCKPGGCVEHTYYVLKCVYYAKRDFWFENKIKVQHLNATIAEGCGNNTGFTTANYKSSAVKRYQNLLLPLVSSVATVVMLTIFTS